MHQRARGALRLSFKQRDGATVLDRLRQEGCLKARFPRREPGAWTGAVTLNSSGGVAGGDTLALRLEAGPATSATIASQAAERFYRALPGTHAAVTTEIAVQPGARLEWLPQETILFDGTAMRRRLAIDLAPGSCFLGVETLIFGRTAMGETVQNAAIDDLIEIRRGGRLILHDRIRFSGPVAPVLARAASAAGSCAAATVVHVAPDAETRLDPVRQALAAHDAGASAWDGMLLARIVARDGACLRQAVVATLHVLRDGRPLPRVWLC